MIGELPTTLLVGGREYGISSDYRTALLIFQAYNDPDLTDDEKHLTAVRCLYTEPIPHADIVEAAKQAAWFLGGGDIPKEDTGVKVLDWEQDEHLIFPAVNRVAGQEVRALPYLHWWTFLGFLTEMGESVLSAVMSLRQKKARGERLTKSEEKYYRDHYDMVHLKRRWSAEEQAENDFVDSLFK